MLTGAAKTVIAYLGVLPCSWLTFLAAMYSQLRGFWMLVWIHPQKQSSKHPRQPKY
jgi:hypothetical protein